MGFPKLSSFSVNLTGHINKNNSPLKRQFDK